MTAAQVLDHLKSGWMLVVTQEEKTQPNGDIECVGITDLTLSMDGETDIKMPTTIFDEVKSHLSEPEREHGCIFIYSLAE